MFKQFVNQASAAELAEKHYSDLSPSAVARAIRIDPSRPNPDGDMTKPMGDYARQLLAWERKRPFLLKETSDPRDHNLSNSAEGLLQKYSELRKYLPTEYQNINKFPTYQDFVEFMVHNAEEYAKKQRLDKATKESSVFYEDDEWIVRIPKTYFASHYFGDTPDENGGYNTRWCTTYSSTHYNHYAPHGVLLMILHKEHPARSCQLYIARDQNSDHPFEIKRYGDGGTDAGSIPPPIREKVLEKFGFDTVAKLGLKKERWEEDADTPSENRVVWQNECRAEIVSEGGDSFVCAWVGVEVKEFVYEDEELVDIDYVEGVSAELHISAFDYRRSSPESLAKLGPVNPLADLGLVVIVDGSGFDSGDAPMNAWLVQNYGNAEHEYGGESAYEIESEVQRYLSVMLSRRDGKKLDSWEASQKYREQLSRAQVPFVLYLCKEDLRDTDDLFDIDSAFLGRNRGSEALEDPTDFTYDGVTYPYVIVRVNDAFGTLEDALQNRKFADFMAGEYTSSPDQEKRDGQLKFEGIDAARRLFAARKDKILAAAKARRA